MINWKSMFMVEVHILLIVNYLFARFDRGYLTSSRSLALSGKTEFS